MATTRANRSCVITPAGGLPVTVKDGDRFDDDDPIVREFPWLFGDAPVEEATSRPGERRKR